MIEQLNSTSAIISALGGTQTVADMFGCGANAVGNWRTSNKFPAHTFPQITQELLKIGAKADPELWRFERKKRELRDPSETPATEPPAG